MVLIRNEGSVRIEDLTVFHWLADKLKDRKFNLSTRKLNELRSEDTFVRLTIGIRNYLVQELFSVRMFSFVCMEIVAFFPFGLRFSVGLHRNMFHDYRHRHGQ